MAANKEDVKKMMSGIGTKRTKPAVKPLTNMQKLKKGTDRDVAKLEKRGSDTVSGMKSFLSGLLSGVSGGGLGQGEDDSFSMPAIKPRVKPEVATTQETMQPVVNAAKGIATEDLPAMGKGLAAGLGTAPSGIFSGGEPDISIASPAFGSIKRDAAPTQVTAPALPAIAAPSTEVGGGESFTRHLLPKDQGFIAMSDKGNVGGLSGQEVLSRLAARMNGGGGSAIPQATSPAGLAARASGGVPASEAINTIRGYRPTQTNVGGMTIRGREDIGAPQRSARLNQALFPGRQDMAAPAIKSVEEYAMQFSGGKTPGLASMAAGMRMRNAAIADQVRAKKTAMSDAKASREARKFGIDQSEAASKQSLRSAQTDLTSKQAGAVLTPEQARKSKIDVAKEKAFMSGIQKIMSGDFMNEEDRQNALEALYAAYSGKKRVITQEGTPKVPSNFLGIGGQAATPTLYDYVDMQ